MPRTTKESRLTDALNKVTAGYARADVHKVSSSDLPPSWRSNNAVKTTVTTLQKLALVPNTSLELPSATGDTSRVLRAALSTFATQSTPCSYDDVIDQQLQMSVVNPFEFERDKVFSSIRGFISTLKQVMTTPRYPGAKVYPITKLHDEICLNIMGTFITSLIGENMCRKYHKEIRKEFKISRHFKVFTCVIPRRVGKTFTVTAALAVLSHCRWLFWGKPTDIGLYAQNSKQARGVASEIAQVLRNLGHTTVRDNETETIFASGIRIFKGSSKPDSARGQGHSVIFVDEAYYTVDDLFQTLVPLLQVEDAIMIAATTARASCSVEDILRPMRDSTKEHTDDGYDSEEEFGPRDMRDMLVKSRMCRECLDYNNSVMDTCDRRKCYHTCMEHPAHLVDDDGCLMDYMLSSTMLASEIYGGIMDEDHRYFNDTTIQKLFEERANYIEMPLGQTVIVIGVDPSPGATSQSAICAAVWNKISGECTLIACESKRTAALGFDSDEFVDRFFVSLFDMPIMRNVEGFHKIMWFIGVEACGGSTAATHIALRANLRLIFHGVRRENVKVPRMYSRQQGEQDLIEYGLPLGHFTKGLLFNQLRADINNGRFKLGPALSGLSTSQDALVTREKRLSKQLASITVRLTRNARQKPSPVISGKKNPGKKNDIDFNDDLVMAIITMLNGISVIIDTDHTVRKSNVTANPSRVISESILSEEQINEARAKATLYAIEAADRY